MTLKHKTYKKTFAIIEGDRLQIITKDTMKDAIIYCQNYLDQNKLIIIKEIKQIQDFVSPIVAQ